jgi:hypothetical protein
MSFHRTSWSNGQHTCFISGRSRGQISARKLAILFQVLCGYPQSLHGQCSDITLKLGHVRFLSHHFQIIVHLSPFNWTLYSRGIHNVAREPHEVRTRHWCGLRRYIYRPQITSWSQQGMRVLIQCTVSRAKVMFITIQRENISPSKKERNKVVTIIKLPDVCS